MTVNLILLRSSAGHAVVLSGAIVMAYSVISSINPAQFSTSRNSSRDGYQKQTSVALLALAVVVVVVSRKSKSLLPYPPGPRRLPLIGNLLDMPKGKEWETYARWNWSSADLIGSDIIYVNIAGSHLLICNTLETSLDLLDKRSAKYSSRAPFVMANELAGWEWLTGGMPYGKRWRQRRRLFLRHFDPANPSMFQHWQLLYGRRLMLDLLDSPDKVWDHMNQMVAGAIISIAYGIEVKPKDDPFVKLATEASQSLIDTMVPGKYLVDSLPFLKHLPEWFPGATFKREAKGFKILTDQFREDPFMATVDAMNKGTAQPSFVSQGLQILSENIKDTEEVKEAEREAIIDMAANIYLGGADTTSSGIGTFFLAMVLYPEIQKKAQEELDRVLGHGHLPEFGDRGRLPYLEAVVKELYARHMNGIAVPHYSTEDDEYRGYFIPKNTVVIGNSWAIFHDEKMYPNPQEFIPERFLTRDGKLNTEVQDPSVAAFGFGRRECPGRHVGISATWLVAAYTLSAFKFEKAVDPATSRVIEPDMKFHSGLVYSPLPFKFKVSPRSEKTAQTVRMLGQ
ncbi:hypothetical protein NP233_g7167 [Leucocoprinus birnbaumii]|uniref:Cytochrome P450 n=1 Tax=Leucocoprinus birnbaumii TaxID=56174 RepID=A0AAD5YT18_9AGAR|nr:hypothetical protein NP233_g7167 [Leucocoprinus birnbaumii]